MKEEKEQLAPKKYKALQGSIMKTIHQQTGQSGQDGYIPRNIRSSKTKSGRIRESE